MSDKKPVQQELSVHIALLVNAIPRRKLALWVACFFEVFQNDWWRLDTHRMNKFLLLVRIQIAEVFALLARKNWDEGLVDELNEMYSWSYCLDMIVVTKIQEFRLLIEV